MYIPEQGDIVLLNFDPQTGHEQKGRRPALVISNLEYNLFTKAAIVCPIANTNRGIPIQCPLDDRTKTPGVIMCEQLKALDIVKRKLGMHTQKSPASHAAVLRAELVDKKLHPRRDKTEIRILQQLSGTRPTTRGLFRRPLQCPSQRYRAVGHRRPA